MNDTTATTTPEPERRRTATPTDPPPEHPTRDDHGNAGTTPSGTGVNMRRTYASLRARRGEGSSLLTTQEAAEALRLSPSRVRSLRALGTLRGARGFVTVESVEDYARQRGGRVARQRERLDARHERLLQRLEDAKAAHDARNAGEAVNGPSEAVLSGFRGLGADQNSETAPSTQVDGVRPGDSESQPLSGGADA